MDTKKWRPFLHSDAFSLWNKMSQSDFSTKGALNLTI